MSRSAPFAAPDPITVGEMRTRYLAFHDTGSDNRTQWMRQVFQFHEDFAYSPDETAFLSSALSGFDVLVIGGNDVRRIGPLHRRNRALLQNRMTVCLMKGSTPQRRAQLLYSGFDDVMDVEKTTPSEGIARFRAMLSRLHLQRAKAAAVVRASELLAPACRVELLTPKETRMLSALMERPGRPVSSVRLQAEASRNHHPITDLNLKVSISYLRRKLLPGVRILNTSEGGYVLLIDR
ncbi:MAG: winged helix-turn-helix domain-containing protein [Sphingomonadales bacterium]|nr:winged helix-turn-helix domain-containing protein [Sphingomonadales bacterium]